MCPAAEPSWLTARALIWRFGMSVSVEDVWQQCVVVALTHVTTLFIRAFCPAAEPSWLTARALIWQPGASVSVEDVWQQCVVVALTRVTLKKKIRAFWTAYNS